MVALGAHPPSVTVGAPFVDLRLDAGGLAEAVGWARPDEVADLAAPRVVDEPTPRFSGAGLTGVGSA